MSAKLENLTLDVTPRRLREQERYSGKKSLILNKPLFDARNSGQYFCKNSKCF